MGFHRAQEFAGLRNTPGSVLPQALDNKVAQNNTGLRTAPGSVNHRAIIRTASQTQSETEHNRQQSIQIDNHSTEDHPQRYSFSICYCYNRIMLSSVEWICLLFNGTKKRFLVPALQPEIAQDKKSIYQISSQEYQHLSSTSSRLVRQVESSYDLKQGWSCHAASMMNLR